MSKIAASAMTVLRFMIPSCIRVRRPLSAAASQPSRETFDVADSCIASLEFARRSLDALRSSARNPICARKVECTRSDFRSAEPLKWKITIQSVSDR
jgi:hypothetical protein